MTIEFRAWSPDDAEVRASDGDGMSFTGYAAKFDKRSEWMGFTETIAPGAFDKTLRSRNEIKAFVNHNTDMVIGSTRAGTLRVSVDERGLPVEIDLPETTYGRDTSVVVKRGDSNSMSFGFSTVRDEWNSDYTERRLIEVRLHEVSVVTGFAAYRATTANVRSLARLAFRTEQDVEALADAFTALESGAELTADQASIVLEAVDRSRPKSDPEPTVEDVTAVPVSLLMKQLDLAAKAVA